MEDWGLVIRTVAAETNLESGKRVQWRGGNWNADSLTKRGWRLQSAAMFSASSNDCE